MLGNGGPVQRLFRWERDGLQRYTAGTGLIGTTASTTAITIGRAGILTTFPGDVTITGVLTVVGGETFEGLVTVTSAAGAGAAGVLGPEELLVQTTQAATAGATIRNPGYIDWQGRFWDGGASVSGNFGRFGAVVDTIAAGVPTVYRLVWTNTAGVIQWSANQAGDTAQVGTASFAGGLSSITGTSLAGTGAFTVAAAGAGSVALSTAAGTVLAVTSAGAHTMTATSWDLNATGLVTIDSTAGAISIGADADAQAINLGTGAAARTITVGNVTGATAVVVNTGTGASSWTVTGAGTFSLIAGTGDVNLATNATAHLTVVGSATTTSATRVQAGTGGAEFGANATDHTTLLGSATGVSASSLRSGTGAMTFTAGGAWDVNATGLTTIDSTGGALQIGAGADAFAIDVGTGAAARTITIGNVTGATALVFNVGTGGTVFNDSGIDADFRIEGDTNANLFVLDAGTDKLALGAAVGAESRLNIAFPTLTVTANADGLYADLDPRLTEAGGGTHAMMVGLNIRALTLTDDAGAATTTAATVRIAGAPAVGTSQHALWIDAGTVRADGAILLNTDGTGVNPAVAWITANGGTDTGLYVGAADQLWTSAGGVAALKCTATQVLISATALTQENAGTVGTPAFNLSTDTNTGPLWVAADTWGVSTGGVLAFQWAPHSIASAAGATANVVNAPAQTITITGAVNIDTATGFNLFNIGIPTMSAASALTIANSATLYLAGAPVGAGAGPATITNAYTLWLDAGAARFDGRMLGSQGADVASANNLTLGADGNVFEITGAVQINAITTAGWQNGSLVTLIFASTPTVKHNTAGGAGTAVLLLAAASDFAATAGDTLTLILSEQGGTQAWREVARTAI